MRTNIASILTVAACLASLSLSGIAFGQRQMEFLDRGLVALRLADGKIFTSWRLLGNEPAVTAFNLYRVRDGKPELVNPKPLTGPTSHVDDEAGGATEYYVRPQVGEDEGKQSNSAAILGSNFLEIPIQPIPGYRPGDCSVGDLDGDGDYEIVVQQSSNPKDNSHPGITGTPILDAYQLDGTHLWRINLGINIRDGEHYTQFVVYDLDGDGRAEIACKTADGTIDGIHQVIGQKDQDWRNHEEGTLRHGRILTGPEYFTIFDGRTGAALKTVDYIPSRDPIDGWGGIGGNGGNDSYGNRCDRFLAGIAYLDGKRPSVIMGRGVYGRIVLAAWDWREGQLRSRWTFDSGICYPPFKDASPYSGMGGHSLSVADVDDDGKDEIIYQAMTVDDDGKGLFSTGRRHGDSMHVSDFDPERPGLELYLVTENEDKTVRLQTPGAGLHDARTGKILWSHSPGKDIGTGIVADIDPRHPGAEVWGAGPLRTIRGEKIGAAPKSSDWVIWWDGDLLREIYSRHRITKWDWEIGQEREMFSLFDEGQKNRSRYSGMRPSLVADLLGDWREELVLPGPDGKSLRLYLTTLPTRHRLPALMHDPQYRLSVAWQNVAYNKPPHTSFYLGHSMESPVPSAIRVTNGREAKD